MNDKSVLFKAFLILQRFSSYNETMSVSDIARKTGLPLATAHRICLQLCDLGALERLDSGRLRVGVLLWELGSLAPRAHGLREAALPHLEDLHRVTGEVVQFATLDGAEALCLERLVGHRPPPMFSRPGGRLPLHASCCGLVLLAHGGPALLNQVIANGLPRYQPSTITTESGLRAMLASVRATGIAVCSQHLHPGWVGTAAPVFGSDGRIAASVCVMIEAERDIRSFERDVREAGRAITELYRERSLSASAGPSALAAVG